jgi:protein-disulfide isomerase
MYDGRDCGGSSKAEPMNKSLIATFFTAAGLGAAALGYGAGSGTLPLPSTVSPAVAAENDAARTWSQSDIEKVVRDYLVKHPEILIDMQTALETKQREAAQVAQAAVIENASDQIFHDPRDAVLGNPDGKVTIVEFFDYNCGFCKHALSDMQDLVKANPQLRFVLKEFPVLGPDSQRAHVVAMAFKSLKPEKYAEFHQRLLGGEGRATEESAMKVAVALGADEAAVRKAMKDPAIVNEFTDNYELANELEINGTPSYVVGKEVVSGALGAEVLQEKINTAGG